MNYNDYPNYSIYWCDGGNWKVYKGGGSQRRAFASVEEAHKLIEYQRLPENKRYSVFAHYQAVIVRYDSQYKTEIVEIL